MNLKAGKWKWNKSLIFEKVNKIKASTRENNKLLVSEIRWGGQQWTSYGNWKNNKWILGTTLWPQIW